MAAAEKTLTLENPNVPGDWKIVLPRRGKRRTAVPKLKNLEKIQQPWAPADLDIDQNRESKLIKKIQTCIKKVESSQFHKSFLDQIRTPEISEWFSNVLGSETHMQIVIYGIGSIESYETSRLQLSLAILLKNKFTWSGGIEVFDPILSEMESRVLESFGCSVLSINEQGRRQALKPTLFFMPHCEAELYDNLLEANWKVDLLKNVVLFGNSFDSYERFLSEFKNSAVAEFTKHVLAVRKFKDEFEIKTISDDYFGAFHDSSWHFFNLEHVKELHLIKG